MATIESKGKSKHYTPTEKNFFLQILHKYKDVIECKKNNINTLREKEVAWDNICQVFNNSSLITQERNVQQLKKLWTNIKQSHRDIITKERQARFATGEGPQISSTEVDPDIALIAPTLMATAPVLFSSNMDDDEVENKKQVVHNISNEDNMEFQFEENMENKKNNETLILHESNISTPKEIIADIRVETNKMKKRKLTEMENEMKIRRIENIIEQEQQLAEARLKHEETMAAIKQTHLKEINKLELRASLAKTELAEYLLKKEKDHV